MTVSAYIPAFNSRETLAAAIDSIRRQTAAVSELLVVDDGSADDSAALAERSGARVIRHPRNLGRGAARATAMKEARGDWVLGCDAGLALAPDFLARATERMGDLTVGGVFGEVAGGGETAAHRWRNRHLFKTGARGAAREDSLATGGSLLRRAAVLAAGNFDARLRAGEDAELGRRLQTAGWRIICDPQLAILPLANDTARTVLRRYARWNGSARPSWTDYLRFINYGCKVMVREDLRARDFGSALISLACPHVLFWHARKHTRDGRPA